MRINVSKYYDEIKNNSQKTFKDTYSYKYLVKNAKSNEYYFSEHLSNLYKDTREGYEQLCKDYSGRLSVAFGGVVSLREFTIDGVHQGYVVETKDTSASTSKYETHKLLLFKCLDEFAQAFKLSKSEELIAQGLMGVSGYDYIEYPESTLSTVLEFIDDVNDEISLWKEVNGDIDEYCKMSTANIEVRGFIILIGDRL